MEGKIYLPQKEMEQILRDRFKLIWQEVFGMVEAGELTFGNMTIVQSSHKEQEKKLKKRLKKWEIDITTYRNSVRECFDLNEFEDYKDDYDDFKYDIFGKELWTVSSALRTPDPDLARYKQSFNDHSGREILEAVELILTNVRDFVKIIKPNINFKNVKSIKELHLNFMDTDDMRLTGVIGLGIRSELIHRLYPDVFAIMTQRTIWGLYFLTDQAEFVRDEFKKIEGVQKQRTVHEWEYEYSRFCYYSNFLMNLFEEYLSKHKLSIKQELRFGYINQVLIEYAKKHNDEKFKLYKWKSC